jgi:predicted nucleic acid-binding protein
LRKSFAAQNVIADSSALVALISRDDEHHPWLDAHLDSLPWPWVTCEAALAEAFYLVGNRGTSQLITLLRRGAVKPDFDLAAEIRPVLALMDKYRDVPMSLADACLVRITEIVPDPLILSTDADFRIYRRHSRQVIPCLLP